MAKTARQKLGYHDASERQKLLGDESGKTVLPEKRQWEIRRRQWEMAAVSRKNQQWVLTETP
jgi:hypothetical protein